MDKKVHVKSKDTVLVLNGKDAGKKGKVLKVFPVEVMVLIGGVNMSTKHMKPRGTVRQGGLVHQESPINSSKVMLVCPRCGVPTKIGKKIYENGNKSRICKKCNADLDD